EAVASLERARKLDPKDARAFWLMGNILHSQKRHEDAIRHYQGALRLNEKCVQALMGLTSAYCACKRFDDAIAVGRIAVAAAPESADAFYLLGLAFANANRGHEAKGCFQVASRLNPNAEHIRFFIAA